MKQLICPATGLVKLAEVPPPTIGPGELLVRMNACGLCGTDVTKVYSPDVVKPVKLGHELAATIVELGPGLESFEPGERVAIAHHAPNYGSHYSRRGSEPMDPTFKQSNLDPGGFAELIRVPALHAAHTVRRIPAGMTDVRAVFMEPLACCLRALDRVTVLEGDTVLVVGFGAAGFLFGPLLRDRSATVLVSDVRRERLDLAGAWGARAAFLAGAEDAAAGCRDYSQGRGADLVILTVVTEQTVVLALAAVRDGGTLLLFGAKPGVTTRLKLWQIWRREINLISSYSATPDLLPRAMALLSRDDYALEETVSHSFPLEAGAAGFALIHEGRASKVVVTA